MASIDFGAQAPYRQQHPDPAEGGYHVHFVSTTFDLKRPPTSTIPLLELHGLGDPNAAAFVQPCKSSLLWGLDAAQVMDRHATSVWQGNWFSVGIGPV